MREQKKANRVSWASGANLCQVKYFRTADRPSKVGQQTRDRPQLEVSHSYHVVSNGGFTNLKSQIPQVQWKTPSEFVLRSNWLVAAGEESEEIVVQKHRETRVLEAVYPRLSAIPPSPLISLDVEGQFYDDTHTPIVPIVPIEETAAMELSSSETAPPNISIDSPPTISIDSPLANLLQGPSASANLNSPPCKSVSFPEPSNNGKSTLATAHGLEGNPVIAAAVAANAILKSKEPGSLIDTDLLVKLLKDPEMTQKLINKHLLYSTTETGTSESKVFVPAVSLPSSPLPIGKSDNENSKPADAGTEALCRPMTIKLSSSAHPKTGTASGPKPTQPSDSLLRSTNDLLIKSSSHENNQPAKGGNIAATQTSEQLLAANARTGTGSRPKHVMLSVSQTSSTCDLPSKKSTRSQPVSTRSQTETKPVKQSLVANAETGTCSQTKQVALSVSLSRSAPDLPSKKPTNEHGQLANIGSVAMLKPVTDEIVTGSAPKTGTPSASLLISVRDLPGKKSTNEHNQQANTGNVLVSKPVVTQSVAADTGFGTGFRVKTGTPPVSLPISVHDLPGKKSTSEHNRQVNTGNMVVPKPVVIQSVAMNTGSRIRFRTKAGIPPVSLAISVHDLPGKKSTSEHNQQVNIGNVVVPKPVVTQSVAANTGIETGFRIKTGTPPVSLSIAVHDLSGKKSTNEPNQQVNTGNVVVPKPAVTQSVDTNTGIGMGCRIKTVMPPVSLPTPHPEMLGNKSRTEQYPPARTQNVAVPRPLMQFLAANSTNGTGFRPMAVTPSVPFPSSIPDFWSKNPASELCQLANAVAGLVAENQPLLIPRINTLINVVTGPVAENQPLSIPRINAELLSTPPNFGSLPVAKPVHLMGPSLDISRLKKLVDEHGAHVRGGNAPVAGINPVFPNPSKPDSEMLKKMVSEYGLHNNLEISLPVSEPLLVPSPATTFGALAPSREHRQPPQLLPAAFSASPYSAPATPPQLKDMQYYQPLIKQHNGDHELLQQNKPQNYLQGAEATQNVQVMEFEPKFQKPCHYYNTPKGCRNGSRCRFQHDLSKQWRSGGVLQAPSGKRMKSGEELTGRT